MLPYQRLDELEPHKHDVLNIYSVNPEVEKTRVQSAVEIIENKLGSAIMSLGDHRSVPQNPQFQVELI